MSIIEKHIRHIHRDIIRKHKQDMILVISELGTGTWNLRFDCVLILEAKSLDDLLHKMLALGLD